jgi:hypothetical protein
MQILPSAAAPTAGREPLDRLVARREEAELAAPVGLARELLEAGRLRGEVG